MTKRGKRVGIKLMLVEDNPELIYLVSTMIRATSPEVELQVAFRHFDELLEHEAWEGVDIAIVDLHLGEDIHGRDILRYLAKNHSKIVRVISTSMDPKDLDAEESALADRILFKPYRHDQLRIVIEEVREARKKNYF